MEEKQVLLLIQQSIKPIIEQQNKLQIELLEEKRRNDNLLQRICDQDDQIEYLNEQIKKLYTKNLEQEKQIQKAIQNPVDELEETWLYYVSNTISIQDISLKLHISMNQTLQFKYNQWIDEESMWIDLIKKLNKEILSIKELESRSLQALRQYGASSFLSKLNDDLLLIIENLPDVQEEFKNKLSILITLCETISNIWEQIDQSYILGRIILVLVSGYRIEELSFEKENQKIILYVESLF